MAENKKSFILYADYIFTIEKLTDDKAGLLFKHILRYVNDKNPQLDDLIVELVFEPIKQQLKRDLRHWENICQKRSENGKKGGRPRKQTEAKKANGFLEKQTEAKKADNDTDTVNDTVNDTDIVNDNPLIKFIKTELPNVSKLKQQLTVEQAEKIVSEFSKELIKDKLLAMENKKTLTKDYQSVYLTLRNWCKSEQTKNTGKFDL